MINLTNNMMSVDLLRGVKARPIRRQRRIKRDLDPMIPARIALRLAIRIRRQVRPNDHIPTAQQLRIPRRRVGVRPRVILTDEAAGDALELVDDLPLRVLAPVAVKDALGRDLLGLLALALQVRRRRRLGQRAGAGLLVLLLGGEEASELRDVRVLAFGGRAGAGSRAGMFVASVASSSKWAGFLGGSPGVAGFAGES